MNDMSVTRARVYGGLLIFAGFISGVATGYLLPRMPRSGINVDISISGPRIPKELMDLELSESQRSSVQRELTRGTDRIDALLKAFDEDLRLAMDSTDEAIRAFLDEGQRRTFDASRSQRVKTSIDRQVVSPADSPRSR